MRLRMNSSPKNGFTLVEIAIAVAILGLALTTLIGLHTRLLNTYFNERNRTRAAFYAQYLMTMMEVQGSPPETGTNEGDLQGALEDEGFFDSDSLGDHKISVEGWQYNQTVTSVDLPLLEDALRRVDLSISWGEGEDETYSLLYFIDNSNLAQSSSSSPYGGFGQRPPSNR